MAKRFKLSLHPRVGTLQASLSHYWPDKNTEIWWVGGHWRGLHRWKRSFDFLNNLVNLFTAQSRFEFGLQLPNHPFFSIRLYTSFLTRGSESLYLDLICHQYGIYKSLLGFDSLLVRIQTFNHTSHVLYPFVRTFNHTWQVIHFPRACSSFYLSISLILKFCAH